MGFKVKQEPTTQMGGVSTPGPSSSGQSSAPSFRPDVATGSYYDSANTRLSSPLTVRTASPSMYQQQPNMALGTNSGLHIVGKDIKVLVDAINELRQFDLDHVAPLPELVLVGDQSAGKSSLMGALAEIHLPRSQGCCTKCPANIKTSPAESWSCTVSLQQYYTYNPTGRSVALRDVTKNRPFPPWDEQHLVHRKFKEFTNKSELEEAIKWAQIALLNHDQDYKLFIPGTGARAEKNMTDTEAGFSPNVVSVEISGPGLPALSFFDLPGLVQNTGNTDDQYLVKVFENLARKYISHENALIIYALTLSVDPVLSRTGMVISDPKANSRCIGVLTKPDTLSDRRGGHVDFFQVLQGASHKVGHGYFVTKQPGPDSELVPGPEYHHLARAEEKRFFDTDSLWSGSWVQFRHRCGTTCIQEYLSHQLAVQIAQSIPSITEKIKHVVERCLRQVTADIQGLIAGERPTWDNDFQSSWTRISTLFRDLILRIKPMINTQHPSDKDDDVTDLTGDDAEEVMSVASVSGPSDHKRTKLDDSAIPFSTPRRPTEPVTPNRSTSTQNVNPFQGTPFSDYHALGKGFIDLTGIRNTINQYNRPGMPGTINDRIYTDLALLAVGNWKLPLETLLNEAMNLLRHEVIEILIKNIGCYKQTDFYKRSCILVDEKLTELEEKQREELLGLFKLESSDAYTVNNLTFEDYTRRERDVLEHHRFKTRATAYVERQLRYGNRKFQKNADATERKNSKNKWIKDVKIDDLPPDPAADEIKVAGWVRAYYMTAAQRFTGLSIYGRLFRNVRDSLAYYLEDKLDIRGSGGKVNCQILMGEDVATAEKRRELQKESNNLMKFRMRLARLAAESRVETSNDAHYHPGDVREEMEYAMSHET